DGNLVRTIFFNHGEVAEWPEQPSGEWPKGSGHSYIDGVAPWVAAEVVDIFGNTIHPLEAKYREDVDRDPETGVVWGWQPLPGYVNLDQDSPALSNDPGTWPRRWPDQPDWYDQETGDAFWNGFFGMGVKNADLETYFVMDDALDKEFAFFPDATDSARGGLGLRVAVRGFQWSHVLAEDEIFWHYDIKNVGTTDHEKTLFGMFIDFGIGQDGSDDNGEYDPILDITFAWDNDNVAPGWVGSVGMAGYAFLESPGIGDTYIYDEFGALVEMLPGDGIDNDDDGLVDESRNNPRGEYIFGSVGFYNDGEPKWHWEGDENGNWVAFSDDNGNGVWDEGEPLNDDLGADGVGPTDEQYTGPDLGEGDGMPTDGEPSYNQTDKDESDQIGLTSVKIFSLHQFELQDDEPVWNIMAFGAFDTEERNVNLGAFYASGPFTLQAGQTERFSMALLFGEDRADLLRNKTIVQGIYNASYNFSKPPEKPTVTAVAGDQQVTLYWDRRAESSFDRFLGTFDFEGYKIYRATDPALLEPKIITDAFGNRTFRKAIFQCDLINFDRDNLWWVKGTHPAAVNGAKYDMGNESGLVHSWTDTTVQNGQTYYYAVVSYDRGLPPPELGAAGLPPTESTSIIKIDNLGFVTATDINTVAVTPNAPAAGYTPPGWTEIRHVAGPGTGDITLEILDPMRVKDNHTYQVRFHHGGIFETAAYSVVDLTEGVELVTESENIASRSFLIDPIRARYAQLPQEGEVFDGMRISVFNKTTAVDDTASGWTEDSQSNYAFNIKLRSPGGTLYPADYEIRFFDAWVDTSSNGSPAKFTVWNLTEDKPSAFFFSDFNGDGILDVGESMYIRETVEGVTLKTWEINFALPAPMLDTTFNNDSLVITEIPIDPIPPRPGDIFMVQVDKPFRGAYGDSLALLPGDSFEFTTQAASTEIQQAQSELDRVAVVPNPYVASVTWEPKSLFSTGRGARMLEFIHLPKECTIRIYTVRGYLVDTIHHSKAINDGSEFWDMRTKDGMDIAYGLYIFHIDAGEIGETIGKFAVIK
ncbi:MAG: hypothetical protein IIA60_11225, partial [Candidatus Marinimicrobia bacterium]|nr:hypothetical protein [Candidatus Neomarinimicrobiota bacterium]